MCARRPQLQDAAMGRGAHEGRIRRTAGAHSPLRRREGGGREVQGAGSIRRAPRGTSMRMRCGQRPIAPCVRGKVMHVSQRQRYQKLKSWPTSGHTKAGRYRRRRPASVVRCTSRRLPPVRALTPRGSYTKNSPLAISLCRRMKQEHEVCRRISMTACPSHQEVLAVACLLHPLATALRPQCCNINISCNGGRRPAHALLRACKGRAWRGPAPGLQGPRPAGSRIGLRWQGQVNHRVIERETRRDGVLIERPASAPAGGRYATYARCLRRSPTCAKKFSQLCCSCPDRNGEKAQMWPRRARFARLRNVVLEIPMGTAPVTL